MDFETYKTENGWAVQSKVVHIRDLHKSNNSIAKKNAASWEKENGGPVRKTKTSFRKKSLEISATGKLPAIPDFSAETHRAWRKKLAEVVALVKAGDVKALKRYELPTYSSSPRAIAKYRDLAVMALEAKAKQAA